ncbi:hypothetical protein HBI65_119520 [Parastagonospora nodorum]|nr:hypothetical protein HBH52_177630 [Parastagonospora nodorum]KAH5690195.1 hypothetical protein HBI44_173060 [Parastagonospora nodorum]KAH6095082.1 hypothetical protein HBI65_119520 [Parastagonospora nodorum]
MRLLRNNDYGGFSLTDLHGNNVPPYAILSHTWGLDADEVSFEDVGNYADALSVLAKPGYIKLQFCARRVAQDGLQYFWVDTACINKQSDRELSEAINSMYRWYQRAARCYVYLSDVVASDGWEKFRQSRWFTRGWTLQELLAPRRVDFFDANGKHLGDKHALAEQISYATKIPHGALTDQPLHNFSVEERLTWAQHRRTKREEDGAYSLLGIFDVSMPLVYGEGKDKAYYRLLHEIESSGHRQMFRKYSQYLPSEDLPDVGKALGTELAPTIRMADSTLSSSDAKGKQMEQNWDSDRKEWIQMHWSSEYNRHYRKQYVGDSWVFLDWVV